MLEKWIQSKRYCAFFAFFCATGWSLAYPLIKLSYAEFQIAGNDVGSKVLFAGVRFLVAGVLLILYMLRKGTFAITRKSPWGWLLAFALVNTSLHYLCSYVGLGYIPSSRATIIDSTGGFLLIIFSCLLFADDGMNLQKMLGCVLGFAGIIMMNVSGNQNFFAGISFAGDGLILLNALCSACGGLLTRVVSRKMDMTTATGVSMAVGGGILCIIGLQLHPSSTWRFTAKGMFIWLILILISAVCFGIYNLLLSFHPISKIAIFNAFIPVLGVIFSSFILGEPLLAKYVIACLMVACGVFIVNVKFHRE